MRCWRLWTKYIELVCMENCFSSRINVVVYKNSFHRGRIPVDSFQEMYLENGWNWKLPPWKVVNLIIFITFSRLFLYNYFKWAINEPQHCIYGVLIEYEISFFVKGKRCHVLESEKFLISSHFEALSSAFKCFLKRLKTHIGLRWCWSIAWNI